MPGGREGDNARLLGPSSSSSSSPQTSPRFAGGGFDSAPLLSKGAKPPRFSADRSSGFTESGRQDSLRHQAEVKAELRERKRMQHQTEQVRSHFSTQFLMRITSLLTPQPFPANRSGGAGRCPSRVSPRDRKAFCRFAPAIAPLGGESTHPSLVETVATVLSAESPPEAADAVSPPSGPHSAPSQAATAHRPPTPKPKTPLRNNPARCLGRP